MQQTKKLPKFIVSWFGRWEFLAQGDSSTGFSWALGPYFACVFCLCVHISSLVCILISSLWQDTHTQPTLDIIVFCKTLVDWSKQVRKRKRGRETERHKENGEERERTKTYFLSTLQKTVTARTGAAWRQETGTPSWVATVQALQSSTAAFPGTLAERWIGSKAFRTLCYGILLLQVVA